MDLRDYQHKAWNTAMYPNKGEDLDYPVLGLCGELGEVAEKVKKILRDDNSVITDKKREELIKEFGDVYWYIAAIATTCHINMDEQLGFPAGSEKRNLPWLICFVKELQKQKKDLITAVETLEQAIEIPGVSYDWKHFKPAINLAGVLEGMLKYLALCLHCLEVTRDEVLETNINKLMSRKERGKIIGSGDNR